MASYDIIGNIVLVKFSRGVSAREKKKFAEKFLSEHKNVRTVLEKSGRIKGRLRTPTTKFILGEKTKEVLYRENNCLFRFNVDTCYFSPRLATERREIASFVRRGENVLVMFGGVAPFAIVIGKLSSAARIVSVELGRECSKYAIENVRRNKLMDRVEIVQGDVRRVIKRECIARKLDFPKQSLINKVRSARFVRKLDFDRIVMARPNLKDSFLDVAFKVVKKNGIIHYYGFYSENELGKLNELVLGEAKLARRKVKILRIKKAGEIAARKFRWRADLEVLN